MTYIRSFLLSLAIIVVSGSIIASGVLYFGTYNVSALQQHTDIVFQVLEFARVRSISTRSDTKVPDLDDLDWQTSGIKLYQTHCQQCHGAPGIAPNAFALGMMPAPSPIVKIAQLRPPEDIFWAIRHGIKMSGMPAWKYRLREEEIWQIVALVKRMNSFTTKEYALLKEDAESFSATQDNAAPVFAIGDKEERLKLGRIALQQYDCIGCHEIPKITGAATNVGPPLKGIQRQIFLVGLLPMNADNLIQWIRFPEQIKPGTTMPNMNVPPEHAALMVEYLLSDSVNPK